MIQEGQFFLTNKITLMAERNPQLTYTLKPKHRVIGVSLGILRPGVDQPTKKELMMMLHQIGMIGLDDIHEALGREQMEKVVDHIQKKYLNEHLEGKKDEQKNSRAD